MNELQIFKNGEFGEVRNLIGNHPRYTGFRVIDGFDNLYCISPYGEILSPSHIDKAGKLRKLRRLTPQVTKKGYLRIGLMKDGIQGRYFVHRLVAKTFIKNNLDKKEVNHIDGNKLNNHFSNLEWCTTKENIQHSYDTGIRVGTNHVGERNNKAKLNEKQVKEIINSAEPIKHLAIKFNVSKSCIYKIKQRKTWSYVK
ncbi:MAG: HNH endonuclease [Finegoldia magna]|nr:HNH endonuclease [Finegoldia magna]